VGDMIDDDCGGLEAKECCEWEGRGSVGRIAACLCQVGRE